MRERRRVSEGRTKAGWAGGDWSVVNLPGYIRWWGAVDVASHVRGFTYQDLDDLNGVVGDGGGFWSIEKKKKKKRSIKRG